MATRKWILALPLAATISALVGCGGGSTFSLQNPPPPPPTTLSITFQSAPPPSITINATTTLTAAVSNDPNNYGVDWKLTCSIPGSSQNPNPCGTLSALHTASGTSVTYTPLATFPGNSEPVNITAFATADHAQNVVAPIMVTAFAGNLQGTYVLQAQGLDISFSPYQFAGVIVLDGNGGITSVEQTANFFDSNTGSFVSKSDTVPTKAGAYFVGADGRGTMTINTNDPDVGQNGVETFSLVVLSASQALIAQTDTTESATGTMDLQTWTSNAAPLSGGYAFVVSGNDFFSELPTAFGGVFNIDSPGNISGNGSIADQNWDGTVTPNSPVNGTVSAPDASGAVTLNLNFATFQSTNAYQFTGYIVDATHIKLIESDNSSSAGIGSTGGIAIGQGSATGTFTSASSFSGSYVFGISGTDIYNFAATPATLAWAGVLSADGLGDFTNGYMDVFLQQNGSQPPNFSGGAQISAPFTGTYLLDSRGIGRVKPTFQFSPGPRPGFAPRLFIYLTGNGKPALFLDGGDGTSTNGIPNYPSVGTGIAYPQSTSALTFSGDYGFSFTQQNGNENDSTGQLIANTATDTLAGIVDTNAGLGPTSGNSLTGTFQPPANGRFTGTLSSGTLSATSLDFYMIDSSHGFFVQTDLLTGSSTVGLGYYATRTPVCAGCQ